MGNNRRLKAFVRYDGSGRVIPGGPVLRATKPKVGNWKEINAYKCCNEEPIPSNCIEFVVNTTDGINFGMQFSSATSEFTYTVNWGDGSTDEGSSGEGFVELTHTFPQENRSYTVVLCFSNPSLINNIEFYGND